MFLYLHNFNDFLSKYQAQLDNILRDPSLLDPYQYIQTVLNLRGVSTLIVRIIQPARLIFFTETAVTLERKVEKLFPRWEINRHGEG